MQTSTWAPAVSDRIEAIRQAERPLPHSTEAMSFPSFRAIHADVLKGMISYRIGFSECAHGRASNLPARPEAVVYRVLSGLPRAKFRPDRGPRWPRICARNGPEISLASSVTPAPQIGRASCRERV